MRQSLRLLQRQEQRQKKYPKKKKNTHTHTQKEKRRVLRIEAMRDREKVKEIKRMGRKVG